VAVYKVPVDKFIDDGLCADRVVSHDVVDGLVRKDDAPSESIIGFIALINLNLMLGVTELHADAKVQPCGASAYTYHLHTKLLAKD
jgi:hypothetical protein